MSIFLSRNLMTAALCVSVFLPSLVSAAEEYICEATQSSEAALPVLSESCPIGKGIWGKSGVKEKGLFWIQCGIFGKPMTIKGAQKIYQRVSTDVWMKDEKRGYRCLIGPYDAYSVAKKDLASLKRIPMYKEAFIRDTAGKTNKVASKSKPAKKIESPSKPVPAPKKPKKEVVIPEKTKKGSETVVARRDVKIGDKYYAIPFLMEGYDQFYMEYGIAWNRLNYDRAIEICKTQKMRLPTQEEWQLLIDSQVMSKKQWPLHLPYWGDGKHGLFTSGKVTQLTGTSLLNVVCVK